MSFFVERINVFAGDRDPDVEAKSDGVSYARCSESHAEDADVVYHPNAIQCSGVENWICPDCGESTQELAEA